MADIIECIFRLQSDIKNKLINDDKKIILAKKVYFLSLVLFFIYSLFILNLINNEFVKNVLF